MLQAFYKSPPVLATLRAAVARMSDTASMADLAAAWYADARAAQVQTNITNSILLSAFGCLALPRPPWANMKRKNIIIVFSGNTPEYRAILPGIANEHGPNS